MNPPHRTAAPIQRIGWLAGGAHVLAAAAFTLLATLNAAGYRYGVGDQAGHIPSILRALDGRLFPRDSALLDAQSRLFVFDELLARAIGLVPASLEAWFLALYLLTLILLYAGLVRLGDRVLLSRWSLAAFVAVCAVRHRIAKTSANTLEGYFHPRQLAFAIGVLGLGEMLRARPWTALAAAARRRRRASDHGLVVRRLDRRRAVRRAAAAAATARRRRRPRDRRRRRPAGRRLPARRADGRRLAGDARRQGLPVRHRLGPGALAAERRLPRRDRRHLPGAASPRPRPPGRSRSGRGLPGPGGRLRRHPAAGRDARRRRGAAAGLACLLDGRPAGDALRRLVAGRVPDADGGAGGRPSTAARRPRWAFAALAALAIGRGSYAMFVEHPERPVFALAAPADAWSDVSAYLRRSTPPGTHVLADPDHAWRFGSSLRVLAARDVFLENVKDEAISMSNRRMAQRIAERRLALGNFEQRTAPELLALGHASTSTSSSRNASCRCPSSTATPSSGSIASRRDHLDCPSASDAPAGLRRPPPTSRIRGGRAATG